MRVKDQISAQQQREEARAQATAEAADDRHAPRKLTFAENVILTVKVLAVAGLLLVTLWGLSLLTSKN